MSVISLRGTTVNTAGTLPQPGQSAPDATLVAADLSEQRLSVHTGHTVILNIFPSIDTGVCAASVRRFNEMAAALEGVRVVCVSRDLPFALGRFCGAEGIDSVEVLSDFRGGFGEAYGVTMVDGPLAQLLSRAVVVVGPDGAVRYAEQVPEIGQEPDYDAALAAAAAA